MKELDINIDALKQERDLLQIKIHKLFDYGKFPSNKDFIGITPDLVELGKMEYGINLLEDLKSTIIASSKDG